MVIHASCSGQSKIPSHRVSCQGDDRDLVAGRVLADHSRSIIPIQDRHLDIHQDDIEIHLLQFFDSLPAIIGNFHHEAGATEEFTGDFLIDVIVFSQQHPDPSQLTQIAAVVDFDQVIIRCQCIVLLEDFSNGIEKVRKTQPACSDTGRRCHRRGRSHSIHCHRLSS